jgi:hypothetical protein
VAQCRGRQESRRIHADGGFGLLAGFSRSGYSFIRSIGCIFLLEVRVVLLHGLTFLELPTAKGISDITIDTHLCGNTQDDRE